MEDGTTFNQNLYPNLYTYLGSNNIPYRYDHTRPSNDIIIEKYNSSISLSYTLLYDALITLECDAGNYIVNYTLLDGTTKTLNFPSVHMDDSDSFTTELPKGSVISGATGTNKALIITYYTHPMFIKAL